MRPTRWQAPLAREGQWPPAASLAGAKPARGSEAATPEPQALDLESTVGIHTDLTMCQLFDLEHLTFLTHRTLFTEEEMEALTG